DFAGLSLSSLPTVSDDAATARFQQFLALAGYAQLKTQLARGKDDLIDVFESVASASSTDAASRLAALLRVDPATITTTARQPASGAAAFARPRMLLRLAAAIDIVAKLGVDVATIAGWATPAPDATVAAALKAAMRSRYLPDEWRALAQPIFDQLRRRQR